ncbi:MAG: hypothetical protein AAFN80_15280, partial [Pseudomonadota bacterium]
QLTSQDVRLFRWYPIEGPDGTVYFSVMPRGDSLWLTNTTSLASIFQKTAVDREKPFLPNVPISENTGIPFLGAALFGSLIPFGATDTEVIFRAHLKASFSARAMNERLYNDALAKDLGIDPSDDIDFRTHDLLDKAKELYLSYEEGDRIARTLRSVFIASSESVDPLHHVFDLELETIRRHVEYVAFDGENVFLLFSPDSNPGRSIWRMRKGSAERFLKLPNGAYDFEFMAAGKDVIAASVSQVTLPENFRHRISIWKDRMLLPEIFSIALDEGA